MMFKTNSYNTTSGSFQNESVCVASSSSFVGLIVDTVVAVSIFAILAIICSIIAVAELNAIILAVLSVVIVLVAVLLAALIIKSLELRRPEPEQA